jgi:excisionase family DNA binding protein
MTTVLEMPTRAEQKAAQHTISEIQKISGKGRTRSHIYILVQASGKEESLEIPQKAFTFLKFILGNMAEGKALQLISVESELSTQQAADLLGVSRPFIVKLLEQGKIPFKKVGSHRRVDIKDLKTYERKQQAIRNKNLDFLSRQAQELNLGYE